MAGRADLSTTVTGDNAIFRGKGRGTIRDARVALVPVESIPLVLRADRQGFHFALAER